MTLIESGYADLRKSEKQAADYILDHMDQVPEMPLDRLAKAAKVSQPTVLRMLKALGYDGYKDFRYQRGAGAKQADRRSLCTDIRWIRRPVWTRYRSILQ